MARGTQGTSGAAGYTETSSTLPASTTATQTSTGGLGQQAADIARGAKYEATQSIRRSGWWLTNLISWVWCTLKMYMTRYPPFGAFVISLAVTSALPLGTFLIVTGLSLGAQVTVATVIISLLEGGLLAFSGTILTFVLGGCLLFSLVVVGGMTFVWSGFSMTRFVWNRLGGRGGYGTQYQYGPSWSQYRQSVSGKGGMGTSPIGTKMEELRQTGEQARQQPETTLGSQGIPAVGTSGLGTTSQMRPTTTVTTSPAMPPATSGQL